MGGFLSSVQDLPAKKFLDPSIKSFHKYSIDWSADRIVWGVDGKNVRTLFRGTLEFKTVVYQGKYAHSSLSVTLVEEMVYCNHPSHATRIQLSIWDASSPVGNGRMGEGTYQVGEVT